jgi:hypothetical protein
MQRWIFRTSMSLYCLALFLVVDLVYSNFFSNFFPGSFLLRADPSPRIPDSHFDHGLTANFDGYQMWGATRYRFYTNSLGFKDASTRKVSTRSSSRRLKTRRQRSSRAEYRSETVNIRQPRQNATPALRRVAGRPSIRP